MMAPVPRRTCRITKLSLLPCWILSNTRPVVTHSVILKSKSKCRLSSRLPNESGINSSDVEIEARYLAKRDTDQGGRAAAEIAINSDKI